MALTKRGKRGVWHYDFVFLGKRFQGSTHQTNINKAKLVESKVRSDVALESFGIGQAKTSPLFRDFMDPDGQFLEFVRRHATNKRTPIQYAEKCRRLLEYIPWKELRLSDIDEERIEHYSSFRLRSVGVSAVNIELAVLRRALHLAHEWKLIQRSPRVRTLPGEKIRSFVVNGELERDYFDSAPYPLREAAILILDLGLRPEEVVRLRKVDVTGHVVTVREGKSANATRALPLTQRAMTVIETLDALWPDSEFLFHGKKGKHLTRGRLSNLHTALRKKKDWPADFVLYSFRHTFGTRLAESGASPFHIKAMMGHGNINISSRYIHPQADDLTVAMKRKEALDKLIRGEDPAIVDTSVRK